MNRYLLGLFFLGCAVVLTACTSTETKDPLPSPRLILQITVDQLRGDLPTRHLDQFGDGGFRYLWEQGAVYTDAYHNHANNETIVGHTTLATGATPAAHGMIGNTWSIVKRVRPSTTLKTQDSRCLQRVQVWTKKRRSIQRNELPAAKAARHLRFWCLHSVMSWPHIPVVRPRCLLYPSRIAALFQWPVMPERRFGFQKPADSS